MRASLSAMLALVLCALTGCANLSAIKEFGTLSADGAAYTRLSDEYAVSHDVRKRYTFEAEEGQRAVLTRQAADRAPQRAQLELFHQLLASYMTALADLAADGATHYDDEVGQLADAAVAASFLDPGQAGAVKALTGLLADAATNHYRQRELAQLIARANGPLQQVVGGMVRLMAAFDSSLQDEQAAYTRYQRTLLAMAREQQREPVAAQLLWADGNIVVRDFARRRAAIPHYIATLEQIGAAHQALFEQRNRISEQEVLSQLKQQTRKIRAAYRLARADQ